MRLIDRVCINEKLNAKAKELAPFLRLYEGCLMTAEDFRLLKGSIEKLLGALNTKYPRTRPFEVYSFTESGVYISPVGNYEECVARMDVHKVRTVLDRGEDICPIDMFTMIKIEEYAEAGS